MKESLNAYLAPEWFRRIVDNVRKIPKEEWGGEEHRRADEEVAARIRSEGLPGPADRTVVALRSESWRLAQQGEVPWLPTMLGSCASWLLPRSCEELLRQGASVEVGEVVWDGGPREEGQPLYNVVASVRPEEMTEQLDAMGEETARVLLEAGADPNPRGESMFCALGSVDVRARRLMGAMLEHGGDPLRTWKMLHARPREGEEARQRLKEERQERWIAEMRRQLEEGEVEEEWGRKRVSDAERRLRKSRQVWEARWRASRELLEAVGWERLEASERPLLRCLWKAGKRRYRREVGVYQWARYWGQFSADTAVMMVRGELEGVVEALAEELPKLQIVPEEVSAQLGSAPLIAGMEKDVGGKVLRDGVVGLVVLKLRGSEWVQVFHPSIHYGGMRMAEELAEAVSGRLGREVLWIREHEVQRYEGGRLLEREAAPGRGVPRYWQAKRWKEPGRVLGERGVEVVAADQWHNGFWQEVRVYGVSEEEVERVDVLLKERLVPLQEL